VPGEAVEPKAQPKSQCVSAVVELSTPVRRKKTRARGQTSVEWLEAFERDFWPEYPRKVGKPDARAQWLRIPKQDEATRDAVCDGLDRWKAYWLSTATERRFIPHPSTWLHQERWEDEP
jgi:hypothetical protein